MYRDNQSEDICVYRQRKPHRSLEQEVGAVIEEFCGDVYSADDIEILDDLQAESSPAH